MAEEYKVSKILKYTLLVFNFVLWVSGNVAAKCVIS